VVEGLLALVQRLLQRRVGTLSPAAAKQVSRLSGPALEALAEALLDFTSAADLDHWLARKRKNGVPA
jgi:hypothetical protein